MKLFTIGFTKKKASQFFEILKHSRVRSLIDVRLNNISQLAGFAKKNDLEYFTSQILNIPYLHDLNLAPTHEMLNDFKNKNINWTQYEHKYLELLKSRGISKLYKPEDFEDVCFLCTEAEPHFCHRRVLAEYLRSEWKEIDIIHL